MSEDWYAHALYYDVWFGWDPSVERGFLLAVSERFGRGRAPAVTIEPFCGTGRLLRAMPGRAAGFDLQPAMVAYARAQGCTVWRADAARPGLAPGCCDLAYCLIDSFRHLPSEEAALGHLRAMRRALRPGGVYVLGLDVSGGLEAGASREDWSHSRGDVRVDGLVEVLGDADPRARRETMRVELKVRHGRRKLRLESRQPLRTYTAAQLRQLLAEAGLELAASYDRSYDPDRPRPLERVAGSAVLVLRGRGD